MREIKVKSVIPIYSIGLVWILCALVFPMYRWYDLAIALGISVVVYKITSRLIPSRTILIESEPEPISTGNSELDEILTAGTAYMSELSSLNMEIANEKINKQVNEMMRITKDIFEFIRGNPTKVRQIRQFMNYYLPTTVKLLKNYNEFRKQEAKGDNITSAMQKIEGVLDTIVDAFRKVLDGLFMDKALDTSVDIEVLEKMIREEGF
ncbi:MAG TPA: 5-bromo-4-chloroindolyl phosphate hydrolysis family protein [Clostridiales bacterium]|nr:5-bromo-4-chloroindolyl phosphate hydrolysis family protein [Clostridiales bacterium]